MSVVPIAIGGGGTTGRILPHNREAEQSVLGALMLDQNAAATVRDLLAPEDFYEERHAHIYFASLELSDRGEPIDIVTLRDQLDRAGSLARSGGVDYLSELSLVTPTAASVRHYAGIVVEHAVRRRLIQAGGEIAQFGFDDTLTAQEATERSEQRIFGIADQRKNTDASHIAPILHKTWQDLERMLDKKQLVTGVPTNFSELDKKTQGFQASELIILAARPSVGKTSFALNVARNASVLAGQPTVIYSLEMSKDALTQRLLCSEAGVNSYLLKTGQASDHDFQRIAHALDRLTQAELWIDDTPGLSISSLRARARRMKAQHDIKMVVVDYLQLMHGGRQESRVQEVSDISAGLKSIAKELSIPVLALSQLSRESERRTDRTPQLSDLRDSGCLPADTPVFLPDSGAYAPICEVQPGNRVLAVDPVTWKAEPQVVTRAFSTGTKPVYRLTTASGRSIRATANHPFLTVDGWRRLDELGTGTHIAAPRMLPSPQQGTMSNDQLALLGHLIGDGCVLPRHAVQYTTGDRPLAETVATLATAVFGSRLTPRISAERRWFQVYLSASAHLTHRTYNPVAAWFRDLGIFGLRSYEKRVPAEVFRQTEDGIATFLRHLWATDGTISIRKNRQGSMPAVMYATSSEELARDVKSLLLRFGITARMRPTPMLGRDGAPKGRVMHHVLVTGADVETFMAAVGALRPSAIDNAARISAMTFVRNTNRDVIPAGVWRSLVLPMAAAGGMNHRALQSALGVAYNGSARYRSNLSRDHARRVATAVDCQTLEALADSDVYWDRIVEVRPDGVEEVWDLTVPGHHNFAAADTYVHNSIEQDADIVLFLYREGMHKEDIDKNATRLIVAKNRNGPVGEIELIFNPEQTSFREPHRGRIE